MLIIELTSLQLTNSLATIYTFCCYNFGWYSFNCLVRRFASQSVQVTTKVVQIIKCTCTVFIDNLRNISTSSSIEVSVCRGSYDGYVKHKRNDPMCDPWGCQENNI